jgi:Ca2+-binding RTX toxin-like protein
LKGRIEMKKLNAKLSPLIVKNKSNLTPLIRDGNDILAAVDGNNQLYGGAGTTPRSLFLRR